MEHEEIRPVEIKDLNKTQLILLAILLSFVVSIATGIVTVTLMQQASPAVNQTINRVVQHTIEKVVPDYTPGKTQTIVVKEDDLIVDAISKTRSSISKLFATKDSTEPLADTYYFGNGIFISSSYLIDSSKTYTLSVNDKKVEAKILPSTLSGFSVLQVNPQEIKSDFPKIQTGSDKDIKPGQTVAIINSGLISKDIVQSINQKDSKDESGKVLSSKKVIVLSSSISFGLIGSVVVNVDGNTIGFVVPKGDLGAEIIGIDTVLKVVSDASKTETKLPLSAEALPAIQ